MDAARGHVNATIITAEVSVPAVAPAWLSDAVEIMSHD